MFSSNAGLFTAKLFFKEKLSEVVHSGLNLVFEKLSNANKNETFLLIFCPTVQYGSVVFNYRYTADSIREDDDALLPTEISSVDAFSL